MEVEGFKFYGSTTVGAKGQVVLPAKLRKDLKIITGDKLVVLVHHITPAPHVLIVKSRDLTELIQKNLGEDYLGKLIETQETQGRKKS